MLSSHKITGNQKVLPSLNSQPIKKPKLPWTLLMVKILRVDLLELISPVVNPLVLVDLVVTKVASKEIKVVDPVVEMDNLPLCLSEILVLRPNNTASRDSSHLADPLRL